MLSKREEHLVLLWKGFWQRSFWEWWLPCSPICFVLCSGNNLRFSGCQALLPSRIGFRSDCAERTLTQPNLLPAS